jgi:hypothetical protein
MPDRASSHAIAAVGWVTLAIVSGLTTFAGLLGLTGSAAVAATLGVLIGAGVFFAGMRRAAARGPASVPRALEIAFVAGAVLLVVELALATAFIVNPRIAVWDARPWTPMRSSHSCASAYWMASQAVDRTPHIYDDEIYSLPQADPRAPRQGRPLGPLVIDNYEYPPAFLALPRLIARSTRDFWAWRQVWFALTLLVTVAGIVLVARRFDAGTGSHALWLTPLVLAPPAMVITLVMGNVQLAIIAASLIAMMLFERGRYAGGGILLAFATVSKLYPGLLVFYLLLRRDWRSVGWTAGAALAIVLVTLADFGVAPYGVFAAEVPKLLGGEAFAAFRNPMAVAVNESIPGLAFKLALFGVPGMGFPAAKVLGWAYTVVVVIAAAHLALRPGVPGREPLAWLAILILATLRSPFLPTYAPFPSLWLATLLAALDWQDRRSPARAMACWAVLAFTFGTGGASPQVNAMWTATHTITALVLVGMATSMLRTTQPQFQPSSAAS